MYLFIFSYGAEMTNARNIAIYGNNNIYSNNFILNTFFRNFLLILSFNFGWSISYHKSL